MVDMNQAIIVQAAAEDVEIVNDSVKTCTCPKCGKSIMASNNMVFDSQIRVKASNDPIVCPFCGESIK